MSDQTFIRRVAKNAFSGTTAGMAHCLTGHPFDTIKVRLQTQSVHNPMYNGVADCFFKTIKLEGVGGFYKGVGSPMAGQILFRAVLFPSYFQIIHMHSVRYGRERLHNLEYFRCGAFTAAIVSFVDGPIDLFKIKMQTHLLRAREGSKIHYRHVFHAGYVIASKHGIRGVYQGLSGTLLRNIPGMATCFGVFESLKDYLSDRGSRPVTSLHLMVSGACAGIVFWIAYPADVIKSALMSDESEKSARKYKGLLHCATTLYQNEGGLKRFFRGYGVCLLGAVPANIALFFTLEKCRQVF